MLAKDCVVLLHGMARSSLSMTVLDWQLTRVGYETHNVDYSEIDLQIKELAGHVLPQAIQRCQTAPKMHFITHSLGGILLRTYFDDASLPDNLGHTVMLGPPNQGSEIVDKLANLPGFDLFNGIAGRQLGTDQNSIPKKLGPVTFSLGVIAGNETISPYFSSIIPGADDGKVSVENTHVQGMKDHITLPVTHTFMMNDPAVLKQVLAFLRNGAFDR